MTISRRDALQRFLLGAGALGLRSAATGIPMATLLAPHKATADEKTLPVEPDKAQFLIFATSAAGDPFNANVPGTYDDPAIAHPAAPTMVKTRLRLGNRETTAAAPWASLPQDVLARSCFFHCATTTLIHSEESKVLTLLAETNRQEMLPSLIAQAVAPTLGTLQSAPISLSPGASEALSFQGSPQANLPPNALAELLGTPGGPLANLAKLRDQHLDQLNAFFRSQGTKSQRQYLDRYASSQAQARNLSESLMTELEQLKAPGTSASEKQLRAAVILVRLKVSPVIAVQLPFGGDNHNDVDLTREANETTQSVKAIGHLMGLLKDAGLQDRVTFALLNVFGRTLLPKQSTDITRSKGRDHNANHHCSLIIGKGIRGGIVGGVTRVGNDFGATPVDPATGRPSSSGIPRSDTMKSMGITLARAVGMTSAEAAKQIPDAKVVTAALSGA